MIVAPRRPIRRWAPERPLPPYRFVPGRHPHPTRDPAGHSYGGAPSPSAGWDPERWHELEEWRFGVDLFNAFYFWEAHEAWEGLWSNKAKDDLVAELLQGLIQLSAALLKIHLQAPRGARRLAEQGLARLERVRGRRPYLLGLDLDPHISEFRRYFAPLGRGDLPPLDASVPVLRLHDPAGD